MVWSKFVPEHKLQLATYFGAWLLRLWRVHLPSLKKPMAQYLEKYLTTLNSILNLDGEWSCCDNRISKGGSEVTAPRGIDPLEGSEPEIGAYQFLGLLILRLLASEGNMWCWQCPPSPDSKCLTGPPSPDFKSLLGHTSKLMSDPSSVRNRRYSAFYSKAFGCLATEDEDKSNRQSAWPPKMTL